MAICTENYFIGDREFTRTWSDEFRFVVRDGISYEEAHDPTEFGRTYTEGGFLPPEEIFPPTVEEYEEIINILLGREEGEPVD